MPKYKLLKSIQILENVQSLILAASSQNSKIKFQLSQNKEVIMKEPIVYITYYPLVLLFFQMDLTPFPKVLIYGLS